jgi:hypothetical protein
MLTDSHDSLLLDLNPIQHHISIQSRPFGLASAVRLQGRNGGGYYFATFIKDD